MSLYCRAMSFYQGIAMHSPVKSEAKLQCGSKRWYCQQKSHSVYHVGMENDARYIWHIETSAYSKRCIVQTRVRCSLRSTGKKGSLCQGIRLSEVMNIRRSAGACRNSKDCIAFYIICLDICSHNPSRKPSLNLQGGGPHECVLDTTDVHNTTMVSIESLIIPCPLMLKFSFSQECKSQPTQPVTHKDAYPAMS